MKTQTDSLWNALDRKVRFLSNAATYPHQLLPVETIETHMSFVFLTDKFAYKLKKPVCLSFVDYTGLDARKESCVRELNLNSILAEGVYLDVLPLRQLGDGGLIVGNQAETAGSTIIDWVVKMKRLPRETMLDEKLVQGSIDAPAIREAAIKLAAFYNNAPPVDLSAASYIEHLDGLIAENQQTFCQSHYGIGTDRATRLHETLTRHRYEYAGMLEQRVQARRIVDGHGDLRPEHICLTDPPVVIDRLEIDARARIVDPIDELSLLHIECSLLGHPEVGDIFFNAYSTVTQDLYPGELIRFFMSLRACVRARFTAWHLDDDKVLDKDRWKRKTAAYFALAEHSLPSGQT